MLNQGGIGRYVPKNRIFTGASVAAIDPDRKKWTDPDR
jgi:hypothetical protein